MGYRLYRLVMGPGDAGSRQDIVELVDQHLTGQGIDLLRRSHLPSAESIQHRDIFQIS